MGKDHQSLLGKIYRLLAQLQQCGGDLPGAQQLCCSALWLPDQSQCLVRCHIPSSLCHAALSPAHTFYIFYRKPHQKRLNKTQQKLPCGKGQTG